MTHTTSERDEQIVALYTSGLGYEAVARETGTTREIVRRVVVASGVPRRSSAEQLRLSHQRQKRRPGAKPMRGVSDLPRHHEPHGYRR